MKAHEFFSEGRLSTQMRAEMKRHEDLVGKRVKAIPTEAKYEEEYFTIVGLMFKQHSINLHCVLKSEECEAAVIVEVSSLGKKRERFFYDPGCLLEIVE